ncbi:hypothetical protein ABIC89_002398 [Variovorax boronicumulans]|uniref:hypothetical protein n=1 Tax=Variovorax boronicumulans TaxID=436515 RepID=UPI003396BD8D
MPTDQIDQWVMDLNGKPRSDKELAAEVLVELRRARGMSGQTFRFKVKMDQVLASTRATAVIVAAFLAGHPRPAAVIATKAVRSRNRSRRTQPTLIGKGGLSEVLTTTKEPVG